MIPTSTTETIPFTPQWREGQIDAPVFHLRAGSVIERGMMESELSGRHRAGKVWGYELRQAAVTGIRTLLEGDPDMDRMLELLNSELEHEVEKAKAFSESKELPADPLSADDRRMIAQVRDVLAEHWPEYRDLLAQMERRREIAPIVALQRFCTGWEHCFGEDGKVPAVYSRNRDHHVSDAAMKLLSHIELLAAGNRAYALQYGQGEEKNSSQPPVSEDGLLTSDSDASLKGDGSSTAIAGPKTPARRSRRGSGQ